MKMSEQELRELDAWIAIHIFGWHEVEYADKSETACKLCGYPLGAQYKHYLPAFHRPGAGSCPFYTTDPAAAMEVLKKCAEKLGNDCQDIQIGFCESASILGGKWSAMTIFRECRDQEGYLRANAETLELALCLLAKQLYDKSN